MRWFLILLLSMMASLGATTYTEFYCQTTADNLNAGSTKEDSANTTYAGGTFVRATGVFTVASGNPTSDTGVTNGAWASIYTTSGATIATCVGRITNTTANTLTIDIGTVSGATANVSETAAAATAKVGGAWKGPNAAVAFPFNFIATNSVVTNSALASAQLYPRCNFKTGVTYGVTAAMTHGLAGPVTFQGYTTTPGDGGRATIDGTSGGAGFVLFTVSGVENIFCDLIFAHNGTTGGAVNGVTSGSAARTKWLRCVFHDFKQIGLTLGADSCAVECELYNCNLSNGNNAPAFSFGAAGGTAIRCIIHDNITGTTTHGVSGSSEYAMFHCILYNNSGNGARCNGSSTFTFIGCEFYTNSLSGIDLPTTSTAGAYIENCNFINNTVWGVNSSGSSVRNIQIINCGFGSGTQANGSGDVSPGIIVAPDSAATQKVTYAANVTPWTAPTTGDYRISLAASKSTGRGSFTETAAGFSGTMGYPNIGAVESSSTNTAGGSYTFSQ